MSLIDKQGIINASDLKRETVPVPEWGSDAEVIVQEMGALEMDRLRADITADPATGNVNIRAKVLVRCLVDEAGGRLFVDEEAEALGKKSRAAIQRLAEVANRLNGMPPERNIDDVLALQDIITACEGDDAAADHAVREKVLALAKARFEDAAAKN